MLMMLSIQDELIEAKNIENLLFFYISLWMKIFAQDWMVSIANIQYIVRVTLVLTYFFQIPYRVGWSIYNLKVGIK